MTRQSLDERLQPALRDRDPLARRQFLKLGLAVSAVAGGGLLLGFSVSGHGEERRAGKAVQRVPHDSGFTPNAFVRIDQAGQVRLVMMKVEMGQGIYTAFPMLIAEELEVPLSQVTLEHAPANPDLYTDPLMHEQTTGLSMSVRSSSERMRRAGAVARTLLVNAAARQWSVDPASCRAEAGMVIHPASGRRLAYGALVDAAAKEPVTDALVSGVTLKKPQDFRLIGTRAHRLDSVEKTNGTAKFGIDVQVPGMLYAAVVNCPVVGGKVAHVDDAATRRMSGVREVVQLDNAVAVIGDHTWAAMRGAAALEIEWNEGANADLSSQMLFDDLERASHRDGAVARHQGDVEQAFRGAAKKLDAVYRQPFLAHAPMEPMNCTVHVRADACDIWVGTQSPTRAMGAAMAVTGLPAEKITLHNHLLGGGFGRRLEPDTIAQALLIGRHVDAPVKMTWTRVQDIQHDLYRPCYYDRISAGLDGHGKPVAWTHRVVGSSVVARFAPPLFRNNLDFDAIEVASDLPYDLPNQKVDYVRQEPRGVQTGFWRGVGPMRSTFVTESFIDELAGLAKVDPVAYRLALLGKSPRTKNVLEVAQRVSGWGRPLGTHAGRGVSVMSAFGSFFCAVAEVTVIDGKVGVDRVVCVVDCGQVINPDTIEAQMQGGLIFGITAALHGEITLKDGRVEQGNFNDYRMLRIHEAPKIEVHIVKSTEASGGIGEPGTAVVAPAVTNAIFAATGKRLRTLPVGNQLNAA
ncbi:molybdopterin-dependent oxidoreductase [Paraburkholderia madseniana]|uniref:Molybdopterin-dependent oxidoreductase n=1 Tax=Paraburkholderia madseniana TaxID=2599607 RepID=A0A6N6W268_9BURK|nr:molybdopterin cofactor-binding domain-containing protein [Paraburkholderia madseniana]KAE8753884.1 molybdopterin-dependent oxidoreductase [Paraburkholderia madseniana]